MGDKTLTPAEAEDNFWDSLKKSNTGMLGLDRPGYHAQPMTAYREAETGTIWFFSRDETDLARDVARTAESAMFHYGSKDQNVWACIHGRLSGRGHDREIIDRYWNPVLAAWYPQGKDDPALTILRFDADDGRIWVNEGGFFKFAYEVVKANVTKTIPDAGDVVDVNLK